MSLRTEETENTYTKAKLEKTLIHLAEEPRLLGTPRFQYWKVIKARFPYDLHHKKHDLVVLVRDVPIAAISIVEIEELWREIIPWADNTYDYVKLNMSAVRSIEGTPHLHLLTLKEEFK